MKNIRDKVGNIINLQGTYLHADVVVAVAKIHALYKAELIKMLPEKQKLSGDVVGMALTNGFNEAIGELKERIELL